jgi:hypothetical protein
MVLRDVRRLHTKRKRTCYSMEDVEVQARRGFGSADACFTATLDGAVDAVRKGQATPEMLRFLVRYLPDMDSDVLQQGEKLNHHLPVYTRPPIEKRMDTTRYKDMVREKVWTSLRNSLGMGVHPLFAFGTDNGIPKRRDWEPIYGIIHGLVGEGPVMRKRLIRGQGTLNRDVWHNSMAQDGSSLRRFSEAKNVEELLFASEYRESSRNPRVRDLHDSARREPHFYIYTDSFAVGRSDVGDLVIDTKKAGRDLYQEMLPHWYRFIAVGATLGNHLEQDYNEFLIGYFMETPHEVPNAGREKFAMHLAAIQEDPWSFIDTFYKFCPSAFRWAPGDELGDRYNKIKSEEVVVVEVTIPELGMERTQYRRGDPYPMSR